MRILKLALMVFGILMALVGLIWMGQGSGHFPYPETSFMINDTTWIGRGAILALAGICLIGISRRLRQ